MTQTNQQKIKITITPFLWFDDNAEEAMKFYTSIFKNSKILSMNHYGEENGEAAGRPEGSVMIGSFELEGHRFIALNGGPHFKFTEAISFMVDCEDQKEVDYFWEKLSEGGDEGAQQCGWLKDKFGLSWQIIPKALNELIDDPDHVKSERVVKALLGMTKVNIEELQKAYDGDDKVFLNIKESPSAIPGRG